MFIAMVHYMDRYHVSLKNKRTKKIVTPPHASQTHAIGNFVEKIRFLIDKNRFAYQQ